MSAGKEFKKAGTVFNPTQNVDKREVFMKEVEPFIKAAAEKLKELGMPFVFGVGTAYSIGEDGNVSTLAAYGHGDDNYMPPSLAMAAIALDLDHTGCISCFMKEAIQCGVISPDAKIALPKGHPVTQQLQQHLVQVQQAAAAGTMAQAAPVKPGTLEEIKAEFFANGGKSPEHN